MGNRGRVRSNQSSHMSAQRCEIDMIVNNRSIQPRFEKAIDGMDKLDAGNRVEPEIAERGVDVEIIRFDVQSSAKNRGDFIPNGVRRNTLVCERGCSSWTSCNDDRLFRSNNGGFLRILSNEMFNA